MSSSSAVSSLDLIRWWSGLIRCCIRYFEGLVIQCMHLLLCVHVSMSECVCQQVSVCASVEKNLCACVRKTDLFIKCTT